MVVCNARLLQLKLTTALGSFMASIKQSGLASHHRFSRRIKRLTSSSEIRVIGGYSF